MKKAVVAVVVALCVGVTGCSQKETTSALPALAIPAGQVIDKLTEAGFTCHLNDGDQPFFACRDAGMSNEPLTPFISVDINTGIDVTNAETCFSGGEKPTLKTHPGLAYPVVLAKGFEAAWVPSNDQMGDSKATAAVLEESAAPMKRLSEVVGVAPTTVAEACGIS